MKDNKIIFSIVLNMIIFILTVVSSVIMFTGYKFMDDGYVLESTKVGMFRFFTVDSNIFMGIVALIFAIKEIEILKGKNTDISIKMYIIKLMATVGVALTFITVFGYLGPIAEGGVTVLLKNSNLFFHLIIPILSIVDFILFEKTDKLEFKITLYGLTTAVLYGIYYLINVLVHMENGKVSPEYDWYWFVQGGIWQIIIVVPLIFGITYIISLLLWKLNRKVKER